MVTIVDYKTYQKEDGSEFYALELQGKLESVKSKETQRTYLTARKARVNCTFDEEICKSLIGTQLAGSIQKVEVQPYDYTSPQTGEMLTLTHRYEFIGEEESILKQNVIKEEAVI